MLLELTDRVDSAHHLIGHGRCERPHGHTYRVDVVLEQPLGCSAAEMLKQVKALLDPWDHIDLNDKLEFPSCEHIAVAMYRELDEALQGLKSVRVWEGHGKWAQVRLGDAEIADPQAGKLRQPPGETVEQQRAGFGDK